MKYQKYVGLGLMTTQIVGVGCGSSAGTSLTSVSLANLPSASSMVTSSTSNVVVSSTQNLSLLPRDAGSSYSVSGTPPLLLKIGSSAADGVTADQAFWNGLIATMKAAGTITQAQANAFFGEVSGGPGGQGACNMAQGVTESLGRMLQSGSSACFMKNIPKASGGVTVTSGTVALASLFDQTAADRLVKISTTGQPQNQGGNQDVFIKISGSNTTGSTSYKAQLYFCNSSGVVTGAESIAVDKSAGTYSFTHDDNSTGNLGRQTLSGKLINSNGSLAFDNSAARIANVYYANGSNIFKGNISVSGGQLVSKRYNTNVFSGNTSTDKNYSIASLSGSDMNSLRFLAGGYKGASTYTFSGTTNSNTYQGGVEYQNTFYANSPSSSLATTVAAYSLASDSFYSDTSFTPNTFSGLSCSASADSTVTMDFTSTAVAAIATKCNGDQIDNSLWQMCYSSDIQTVMNKIWNQAPPQSN
jgi:hypothetical protein